jgi:type I restriction-modification system DNA methylase subunit
MVKAKMNNNKEPIEKQLWKAADKLRKNIDAAEYKHIVLGLIFLRYISDAFEELFDKLEKGEGDYAGADPEDRDEYKAENVFLCRKMPAGLFSSPEPNYQKSAKLWIMQWMLSKRTIHLSGMYCQKSMPGATLILQTLAA